MPILEQLKSNNNQKSKILILGSGGLSIGQAGEFDYSGTQALKALLDLGFEVIIVNPNIATVQTNPQKNVKVYLYPVEPRWVEKVIKKENPKAISASFGGQTAINCLISLNEQGVLQENNIINLGTSIATLAMTEDRELFAQKMQQISQPVAPSIAVNTIKDALEAAVEIGYPVIVRSAFALGGLGSGFANNSKELQTLGEKALNHSNQILVEKSLKGWKEVEYEVMRDSSENTITICNMENFDPLGIHTGDSIVICPSQTLSDDEYQLLRNASLEIVNACEIVGECNVQFALNPISHEYFVIEVNARLSRSSALASKASGYPIAYIAAKVVLGFNLLEIQNPVTEATCAFFEPAFDYVAIKVPRWDLSKFHGATRQLDSTMKSIGEIMSIGRSFSEAFQKATRMISEDEQGIGAYKNNFEISEDALTTKLEAPTDDRVKLLFTAFRKGFSIDKIAELTNIDRWFLSKLAGIVKIEQLITEKFDIDKHNDTNELISNCLAQINKEEWLDIKKRGFSDAQIAALILESGAKKYKIADYNLAQSKVRKARKQHGVLPYFKKIDTTAGEYPAKSNYLYATYYAQVHDDIQLNKNRKTAITLGGGAYRIGASVEFDWCAVSCSQRLQQENWNSVIINCNPETVSTDYNNSDRLYFEELTVERILDVCELEQPEGVIVCMGGQLPNSLAEPLAKNGINIMGHSPDTLDKAEDRAQFSKILDDLKIDQPKWVAATSADSIDNFTAEVGFPVLVRPSFVLSGAAMKVATDEKSLKLFLDDAANISKETPVVVSEFIRGAREIELDGIAQNGKIVTAIVSEHIENAGVHSGDATTVVPAQRLYVETVRLIRKAAKQMVHKLNLHGPFNIQFLALHNKIKVIECNARAARSFPFISKVVGLNLADAATQIILGLKPQIKRFLEEDLPHVGVKAAMFSFSRLGGVDPILGVEMAATGEVGCLGKNMDEALLLAMEATRSFTPSKGILVSAGSEAEKLKFLVAASNFKQLGLPLFASIGTAKFLQEHGFECTALAWPNEGTPDCLSVIKNKQVDLVINIPKNLQHKELTHGANIRKSSIIYNCMLLTNMEKSVAYSQALVSNTDFIKTHEVTRLMDFH